MAMKSASEASIEQFKKVYKRLRETQKNKALAEKLGMGPANLSSLASGRKTPGEDFINKFREVFKEDIAKLGLGYESTDDDAQTSKVAEAHVAYMHVNEGLTIYDDLKARHERLNSNFDKIVETNQKMAESQKDMAESQKDMAK